MAQYRPIHTKLYADPVWEKLKENARWLWAYLITSPHRNESCLYTISMGTLTHDTGMNEQKLRNAFEQLQKFGRVLYDFATSVVWVVNAVKYQTLNTNCKVSIWKDLAGCSCPDLIRKFIAKWGSQIELTAKEVDKSPKQVTTIDNIKNGLANLLETPSKPLANVSIGLGLGLGLGIEGGQGETSTHEVRHPSKPSEEFDCLAEQLENIRLKKGERVSEVSHFEQTHLKQLLQKYRYRECSLAIAWCGKQGWRGTISQIEERLKTGPHEGKREIFAKAHQINGNPAPASLPPIANKVA